MKDFNIYHHNTLGYKAVKVGWGWPAFCFGAIWAFFKGLIGLGFGLIGVSILLEMISFANEGVAIISGLIGIGIAIWLGNEGNKLVGDSLLKKGYQFCGTQRSENPDRALMEFSNSNDTNHSNPNTPTPGPYQPKETGGSGPYNTPRKSSGSGYEKGDIYN